MLDSYNMNTLLIFLWIYAAMIANSIWEASAEGRNAGNRGKIGFSIKFGKYYLTSYHIFLFLVMWPLLITLPLIIYGWNFKLFGILLSAFFSGLVLEDFMWFAVNPAASLKDWNPKFADYYPWIKIGRIQFPLLYLVWVALAVLSWYFIWG